jgi:hypothetical protein
MADTEKKSSFKLDFGEAAHKAQRKAFDIALDAALKHAGKDRQKAMLQVVDLMEKTLGDTWRPEAYWNLRNRVFNDADSKWMKFTNAMFDDVDPKIIKLAMMNMGYEGGFRGFHLVHENAKKYGCDPFRGLFCSIRPVPAICTAPAAGRRSTAIR